MSKHAWIILTTFLTPLLHFLLISSKILSPELLWRHLWTDPFQLLPRTQWGRVVAWRTTWRHRRVWKSWLRPWRGLRQPPCPSGARASQTTRRRTTLTRPSCWKTTTSQRYDPSWHILSYMLKHLGVYT